MRKEANKFLDKMARRKNKRRLFESILDNIGSVESSSAEKIKSEDETRIAQEKENVDIEPEKYQHLMIVSYAVDYYDMERKAGYIETVRDDFKNGVDDLQDAMSRLLKEDDFKVSLVLIQEDSVNTFTKHNRELYKLLEIPILNYEDENFINWGNDRARIDVEDHITINLRIQFNLKDKSVHFYTKFMRRIIPPLSRMMIHTDKDLQHSEVQCYTFLKPEWALDPRLEYFCSLEDLADDLTISYRNEITIGSQIPRTYCVFNKVPDEECNFYFKEFWKEGERLTRILQQKS